MSSPPAPEQSRVRQALSEQREALREQLSAAWQLQASRIEEQLHTGWQEHIERAFRERFEELAARLEREYAAELDSALRTAAGRLHAAVRRLGQAQAENEWADALAGSAAIFAPRTAVFILGGGALRGAAARGIEGVAGLEIPVAPAFASAIASGEPVAALRSPAEISEALASALGPATAARCLLTPVQVQHRTLGVLYAEGDEMEPHGLEAIAALAGAHRTAALAPVRTAAFDWSQLPPGEQELHLRAQRFARVRTAEMRLYKSEACLAGREKHEVYGALREEIDAAREAFRREFMLAFPAMPDYLHWELIRTLANNDVAVLGDDYPGPLF